MTDAIKKELFDKIRLQYANVGAIWRRSRLQRDEGSYEHFETQDLYWKEKTKLFCMINEYTGYPFCTIEDAGRLPCAVISLVIELATPKFCE